MTGRDSTRFVVALALGTALGWALTVLLRDSGTRGPPFGKVLGRG